MVFDGKARRLGWNPSYVPALLNPDSNMTLMEYEGMTSSVKRAGKMCTNGRK